jgi:CRISPR-associated protein Csm1
MSEQVLLQGKLLGIEEFLVSGASNDETFSARSLWITLVGEIVPRALLAELQLPRLLLGSSGGGQFLAILPGSARAASDDFLTAAAKQIAAATSGHVELLWAVTENLGDWTVVRKRLNDELQRKRSTPLATMDAAHFWTIDGAVSEPPELFREQELREASIAGWPPDLPTIIALGPAKHTWTLTTNLTIDDITLARHAAPSDDEVTSATAQQLARRAEGRPLWGVLRGDVDDFGIRLRRLQSIEEHVQLSMLYKQFFAGELEVLCSMPEFWRKVTILYSGGDDFAVYGSWDALILLARELQRMFQLFTEENLKDYPGAEAKTISMALSLAKSPANGEAQPVADVYEEAGRNLALAKAVDKDCIYLMGRIIEWKQLGDAADLKDAAMRIGEEFRQGRQFLSELRALYQKVTAPDVEHEKLLRRAYRFQRRYGRVASSNRDREFQKLRTHLINEIVGRNVKPAPGKRLKLRPAGVVALEWVRLAQEV